MTDTNTISRDDGRTGSPMARFGVVALVVAIAAIVLIGSAWGAARLLSGGTDSAIEPGIPVEVTVPAGASAGDIYRELADAGVATVESLEAAARSQGVESRLRAGTYQLTTGSDPDAVIAALVRGPDPSTSGRFVVIEGWTVDRIVEEVAAALDVTQAEVQRPLRSGELDSPYLPPTGGAVDDINRWEGLLAPATYPITPTTRPDELVAAMVAETNRRLDSLDWSRLGALGIDEREAVVVASLIEREAGTDEERPQIASVIHNRLDRGMRLQIDATVIYALGYNPGRVSAADLQVESPWNTYAVDGLPPTPIGAPSLASLRAAVDPATTPYLFYVLGFEDGSHRFAETYDEHQANIARARADGILP